MKVQKGMVHSTERNKTRSRRQRLAAPRCVDPIPQSANHEPLPLVNLDGMECTRSKVDGILLCLCRVAYVARPPLDFESWWAPTWLEAINTIDDYVFFLFLFFLLQLKITPHFFVISFQYFMEGDECNFINNLIYIYFCAFSFFIF